MWTSLETAFRTARYYIDCGERAVERRIGIVDPKADAALRRAGCRRSWAVITPCNPGCRRLRDAENAQRLRRLYSELARRGYCHRPAFNCAADGSWPEPGVCLFDIEHRIVVQLARRFRQLAYVAGRLGSAPALYWTQAWWIARPSSAHQDAALINT